MIEITEKEYIFPSKVFIEGVEMNGMISVIHVGDDARRIGDVGRIKKMLIELVRGIGMTPHGRPRVMYYPNSSPAKNTHTVLLPIGNKKRGFLRTLVGWIRDLIKRNRPCLAVQYLYESFVIYDNWPELGYAHLIVDSCKPYDIQVVLSIVRKYFSKVVIRDPQVMYGPWALDDNG